MTQYGKTPRKDQCDWCEYSRMSLDWGPLMPPGGPASHNIDTRRWHFLAQDLEFWRETVDAVGRAVGMPMGPAAGDVRGQRQIWTAAAIQNGCRSKLLLNESKPISIGNYQEFPTAFSFTKEWLQANLPIKIFIFSQKLWTNFRRLEGWSLRVTGRAPPNVLGI